MNKANADARSANRWWFALLVLALTGFTALLAAELILRAVRFPGPIGMAYVSDSVQGHRLRPGFRIWYRAEGDAFFTVNSDGMPDAERSVAKPDGTFRVAVVGDSFTQAAGTPRERRFTAIINQRLSTCPALRGQRVETLAFGVSAYSASHELLEIRRHVFRYSPDVILLQVFLGNDLRANVRELSGPEPMPYFVHTANGWELDSASRHLPGPRRKGWLLTLENASFTWLRTLHVVQAVRVNLKTRKAQQRLTNAIRDTLFGFEPGASWEIFLEPRSPDWDRAWQVSEGLLSVMHAESREHGAMFHVASFPSGIQVHPSRAKREAFLKAIGAESFSYPGTRLKEIGRRLGIPVLDLEGPMRTYAESTGVVLYGYPNAVSGLGHWNAHGHSVGGKAIASWLCESLQR